MSGKMERRGFLKFFSVGMLGSAFSNLFTVRKRSVEYLMPYVVPPEGVIPGIPNWYSSVCRECPAGCGIQVKVREGRAKKIEGNPDYPVNYGRSCARGQAGLQSLYHPERVTGPMVKTEEGFEKISWDKALKMVARSLREAAGRDAENNVAFITDPIRGNLAGLISTFFNSLGAGKVYSHQLFADEAQAEANERCFGRKEVSDYDFENTRYILSIGSEFMDTWASPVKHSVGYGRMRDRNQGIVGERGWLTAFESRLSVTGGSADEWHPITPETEGILALGIANVVVNEGLYDQAATGDISGWKKALADYDPESVSKATGLDKAVILSTARAFAEHAPSVAVCGGGPTAQTNGGFNAVAVNILNYLVGSAGKKGGVRFTGPTIFDNRIENNLANSEIADLVEGMARREIDVLFINNTNPVFTLPGGERFSESLEGIPLVVSLSGVMDETTARADLILPDSDALESWGDYIPPVDSGHRTVGLMQPVVTKMHNSRPVGEVFLELAKRLGGKVKAALPADNFEEYLKESWRVLYRDGRDRGLIEEETFSQFWDVALENGGWWEKKTSHVKPAKRPKPALLDDVTYQRPPKDERYKYHLQLFPSLTAFDGRGANKPWLQQLPAPLVTVAWGSWAAINPETADKLDIKEGDMLEISSSSGKIEAPAYIYYAIHPDTIAIPIGQGHTGYGQYADGYGVNPMVLVDKVDDLTGGLAWSATNVDISKTGETHDIVKTDPEANQPGLENGVREMDRHIVQWIGPEEAEKLVGHEEDEGIEALPTRDLRQAPHFLSSVGLAKYRSSKYHDYKYRWGMVIDLDKCNGCAACTAACYAENNLPLMSEYEMGRGRHMNWMRVDRYWEGDYPEVRAKVIPMNCYQCGNASCEPVCPVYAAYHTVDGLNGQVYPRCVGTRYCNAGCPYKARRYNWTKPEWQEPLNQQLNTDVSVRFYGVTEKCTFCVQRIRAAKDTAKDEDRRVKDGEVVPACAQTCPTGAISFGDLLDPDTHVAQLTKDGRRYRVLEELNNEPAVVYLKAVRASVKSTGGSSTEH